MQGEFTIPPFLCDALWRSLSLNAALEPDFIIGGGADPYLRRWHLLPRGEGASAYLHQFLRSDDDRALHDHPYGSVSIILRGAYHEHLAGTVVLRQVGDVVVRDAVAPHRVELLDHAETGLPAPCWTLFLTGPRVRDWGFHCSQGWVRWQDFVSGRDAGAIGQGCG